MTILQKIGSRLQDMTSHIPILSLDRYINYGLVVNMTGSKLCNYSRLLKLSEALQPFGHFALH